MAADEKGKRNEARRLPMQTLQPHRLIKWYDNKSVMLLGSHLEEITSISTVQRRLKGSSFFKMYWSHKVITEFLCNVAALRVRN